VLSYMLLTDRNVLCFSLCELLADDIISVFEYTSYSDQGLYVKVLYLCRNSWQSSTILLDCIAYSLSTCNSISAIFLSLSFSCFVSILYIFYWKLVMLFRTALDHNHLCQLRVCSLHFCSLTSWVISLL
jgi:vesicle coat complex subunit